MVLLLQELSMKKIINPAKHLNFNTIKIKSKIESNYLLMVSILTLIQKKCFEWLHLKTPFQTNDKIPTWCTDARCKYTVMLIQDVFDSCL